LIQLQSTLGPLFTVYYVGLTKLYWKLNRYKAHAKY